MQESIIFKGLTVCRNVCFSRCNNSQLELLLLTLLAKAMPDGGFVHNFDQ